MKMWSGRFGQAQNSDFEQWQRSFPFDRALLPYEVAASRAHAAALARVGVLNEQELTATLSALDQIAREGVPQDDDPTIEDVHHYVEKRLVELAGEVGYKLHTGRSRNEQIATDLRLYVRDQIDAISQMLVEFVGEFVRQAEAAGENAMPAYTHLQRAEPVLVAHWLLAYVEMFLRDLDRLADCRKRMNECPLGSGAVAGTILPLDREAMANQLQFDSPTANSMDATSDRDFAIEFVQALSFVALHLSRWAEELILYSTTEFGFVKLPEQFSTGSSAMPQKKNPDALELIRGKAGRVFANATELWIAVKGLPQAYNKDLQETQQPIFAAVRPSVGHVARGDRLSGRSFVRWRTDATSGKRWIYECPGPRGISGAAGSSISSGAREGGAGGSSWPREELRIRATVERGLCAVRHRSGRRALPLVVGG